MTFTPYVCQSLIRPEPHGPLGSSLPSGNTPDTPFRNGPLAIARPTGTDSQPQCSTGPRPRRKHSPLSSGIDEGSALHLRQESVRDVSNGTANNPPSAPVEKGREECSRHDTRPGKLHHSHRDRPAPRSNSQATNTGSAASLYRIGLCGPRVITEVTCVSPKTWFLIGGSTHQDHPLKHPLKKTSTTHSEIHDKQPRNHEN